MEEILSWLFSFIFLVVLVFITSYQYVCLADLEFDYINPYDAAPRINKVVLPEFSIHACLSFFYLTTGHWFMFLLSLPCLCYDAFLYNNRQHLTDVTEIYNQLSLQKTRRMIKLGYLLLLFVVSLFWLIWSLGDGFDD